MIHHVGLEASDLARSARFYDAVLFALGIALMWPNARLVHMAALVIFVAYLIWNVRQSRRSVPA